VKPHFPEALLHAKTPKAEIVAAVKKMVHQLGFTIVDDMSDKPWGAGYRFHDRDLPAFLAAFYADEQVEAPSGMSLSPKILLIAPQKRLSWQYHHWRAELWKVFAGPVGTIRSDSDALRPVEMHTSGDLVVCACRERHRIVGLENWAIIAEIWQHTDLNHPSEEEDIVRVLDDFGREGSTAKR
jgi:mannose-6-phosphate isomerase-like protein (cupin superfamily)